MASNKSFLSIPLDLGLAPTNKAISHYLKPSSSSVVEMILCNKGEAVSINSISTPFKTSIIGGISNSTNSMGWSGPRSLPWAIIKTREYPIFPAAPVTVTLTGFFYPVKYSYILLKKFNYKC